MKSLMIATVAVAGFAFMNTSKVEAGHGIRFSVNFGQRSYGQRSYGRRNYGSSHLYRGYGRQQSRHGWGHVNRHLSWHDTSHYDYHPGGYVRHNNHYDYVPGHYDYHRTGHWDTHKHH